MTTFEIVLVIALLVITPLAILCGWHFGRASAFRIARGAGLRRWAEMYRIYCGDIGDCRHRQRRSGGA